MKRLSAQSQNFLRSPKQVASLIALCNLQKDDTVYDLGAGSGIISSSLAPKVKKVVAVEYDERGIATLRRNTQPYGNIEVVQGNILTVPLPVNIPYKVVANIPFHISSPIIHRLVLDAHKPAALYCIVQKQFGNKLLARGDGHFTSQLGMVVNALYEAKILKKLHKTDFWPHPAVDTVFVGLTQRPQPLVPAARLDAYIRFTAECFANRQALAKMPLESIGATAGLSPSRLSVEQWVRLFEHQAKY